MLCHVSKYFGKCFGSFTRATKFPIQMHQLFIIKICYTRLIQSVVRVGISGVCVTSSILRVLLSGFWVSGSQGPSSRVLGVRVPESQVARSQGPGSQGPGSRSQVLILDYAVKKVFVKIS